MKIINEKEKWMNVKRSGWKHKNVCMQNKMKIQMSRSLL